MGKNQLPFKKRFPVTIFLMLLLAVLLPLAVFLVLQHWEAARWILIAGTGTALALSLGLGWFLLNRLTFPAQYLNHLAMELACGEIKQQFEDNKTGNYLPFLISALGEPGGELNLLSSAQNQKLNQKLEDILQFKIEELFEISALSEQILARREMVGFANSVLEMLQKLAEPAWAAFYLYQEPDGFVLLKQTRLSRLDMPQAGIITIPGEKDPLYPLVHFHQPVKLLNPAQNLFIKDRLPGEDFQQYYAFAVVYREKLLGLIEMAWGDERLDAGLEKILQALSRQAGIMLENILLYKLLIKENLNLKDILNYTSAGILKLDPSLKITFFNQAAQKITGFSAEQALGKYCYQIFPGKNSEGKPVCSPHECYLFKDLPGEESSPSKFLAYNQEEIGTHTPYAQYELYFDQLGGEKKILKFIAYRRQDGFLLTFFDITPLRDSADVYETFFPLTTKALMDDYEKNRRELNLASNPSLAGGLENLEFLNKLQKENRDLLLKSLEALHIGWLRGGGSGGEQPVYLEKITEKTVSLFNELYPERKFKIFSELSSKIYTDPNIINFAVFKLLKNAVFYSPALSPVTIKLSEDDRRVCFSVEDQGPDLNREPRQTLAQILQSQNLAQEHYSDPEDLSFYLLNNLLKSRNGQLHAHNLTGKGACFSFTLAKKFND